MGGGGKKVTETLWWNARLDEEQSAAMEVELTKWRLQVKRGKQSLPWYCDNMIL